MNRPAWASETTNSTPLRPRSLSRRNIVEPALLAFAVRQADAEHLAVAVSLDPPTATSRLVGRKAASRRTLVCDGIDDHEQVALAQSPLCPRLYLDRLSD